MFYHQIRIIQYKIYSNYVMKYFTEENKLNYIGEFEYDVFNDSYYLKTPVGEYSTLPEKYILNYDTYLSYHERNMFSKHKAIHGGKK